MFLSNEHSLTYIQNDSFAFFFETNLLVCLMLINFCIVYWCIRNQFLTNNLFWCLKNSFILANSVGTDDMPYWTSSESTLSIKVFIYSLSVFKGRSGVYKEKLGSVLALSDLHANCQHFQELLRLISNLIGLSYKLWKWLTPLISSVAIWFCLMGYSTNTTKNLNFERILIWIFFLYIYIEILEKQISAINHLVAKYINYIIIIIFTYILLLGQQCYKSFSSKVQIKK